MINHVILITLLFSEVNLLIAEVMMDAFGLFLFMGIEHIVH